MKVKIKTVVLSTLSAPPPDPPEPPEPPEPPKTTAQAKPVVIKLKTKQPPAPPKISKIEIQYFEQNTERVITELHKIATEARRNDDGVHYLLGEMARYEDDIDSGWSQKSRIRLLAHKVEAFRNICKRIYWAWVDTNAMLDAVLPRTITSPAVLSSMGIYERRAS